MGIDREALVERHRLNRRRTAALFDLLDEAVYYERPIPLRNPIVFYEGHVPAFAVNTLIKKALGRPGVDAELECIFERGIDPEDEATAVARGNPVWPSRTVVRRYVQAADRLIEEALRSADLERPGDPLLDQAQAVWAILEHEEMHQETLGYICHQVAYGHKRPPAGYDVRTDGIPADVSAVARIPAGMATLGTDGEAPFAWDNEQPAHEMAVAAFAIDVHDVTNGQFRAFVEAGGYADPAWWRAEDWAWVSSQPVTHPFYWEREGDQWFWKGMFERLPLPEAWPVYVTWAEANAYARWRGRRLPSEAQYHRAAFGTHDGERAYPWRETNDGRVPGNFDFTGWDPVPVGCYPDGVSAFGVHDLVGNGWEWTATPFGPFPGFTPLPSYPEYSADFFDGEHFVMKGASPLTARAIVRRGFRNWFRPRYPFAYATFRCVQDV